MSDSTEASPFLITSRATAADAGAIARLLAEAFAEYRPLYTPEAFAATTPDAQTIASRIAEGPTWIVRDDMAIIGTLSAVEKRNDVYLHSMAVAPRARGRRIGERLLESAEAFARDRDLVLSTTPFLHRAIALYERWGFRRTDAPPHDLHGTPLFTMRLRRR